MADAKYYEVGDNAGGSKFYTLDYQNPAGRYTYQAADGSGTRTDYRPVLAETNLGDIRGRMGDKPAGFDFNAALETMRQNGEIQKTDTAGLASLQGKGINVPATIGKSNEFQNYLQSTGQTYNAQTGQFGTGNVPVPQNEANISPHEIGFNDAIKAGIKDVADAGVARGIVSQYTPQAQYDGGQANVVMASNQAHQQYLNDFTQAQSSNFQTQSLTQEYLRMSQQMGIPALDIQLLNMKTVMDGSEQDIRNEIQAANGFSTNSQVLALTAARNKTLIQNYNNLLQTRDNLQKNLTTIIGLSEKDRVYASQLIDRQLNFDQQQIAYTDKMLKNAQDSLNNTAKVNGWDAVLKSALASGDPQMIQKINSTMGNGFDLATMAKTSNIEQLQKEANLTKTLAEIRKLKNEGGMNMSLNNYIDTTSRGKAYVNSADIANKAEKSAVEKAARAQNIPLITNKDNSEAFTNLEVARQNASKIENVVSKFAPSSAFTRLFIGPKNIGASVFQTNEDIASYKAYRSAAIEAMRAMAGSKGLRINQAEIALAQENDIPKITDTLGVAKAKLNVLRNQLQSWEDVILKTNTPLSGGANDPLGLGL